MEFQNLLILLLVIAVGMLGITNMYGGAATSPATLMQLGAVGAQDMYLTGDPSW